MALEEMLSRKIGPLPVGGWLLLVGGTAVAAFTIMNRRGASSEDPELATVVEQVPVPVGAIAYESGAPYISQSISYFDGSKFDQLGEIITKQIDATKSNTTATNTNTGAINGNTDATEKLTRVITTGGPSVPKPTSSPKPKPTSSTKSYTVKSGDTLSGIARRFTGNANRWPELYQLNKAAIDASAKRRGKKPPYYNHIISGQVFRLPAGW